MTHSNCRSYVITASKHRGYVYTWDHFVFWLLRGPVTVTVVLSLPPDLKQICRNGQVALRENWSKFDNICLRSCYLFTEIKCTRAGMGYSMWLYICLIETFSSPKSMDMEPDVSQALVMFVMAGCTHLGIFCTRNWCFSWKQGHMIDVKFLSSPLWIKSKH